MSWGARPARAVAKEGARERPRALEEAHGMALMGWVKQMEGMYPALQFFHHIPNGGKRTRAVAGKMKAQGVRRGVWDYSLPAPYRALRADGSGGLEEVKYHGLYIELKDARERNTKCGGLSAEQMKFGVFVSEQGYATVVAYEWTEAQEALKAYINGQPIPFFWRKVQHD